MTQTAANAAPMTEKSQNREDLGGDGQREVGDVQLAAPVRFMARQSILDRRCDVHAYELLFRGGPENYFEQTASVSARVMDRVLLFGLENLTGSKRAFINLDEEAIRGDIAGMLPRSKVVLEILESVPPNREMLEACNTLKEDGYLLALDDFSMTPEWQPFLEICDYVKVDFRATKPTEQERLVRELSGRNIGMIAEKIETREEFQSAKDMGYSLFQGYFLTKPEMLKRRDIPRSRIHYVRLLRLAADRELNFDKLEETVKEDPSLCYKLLRYLNAAAFHAAGRVSSIRQAMVLLGEKEMRRWIAVAAAASMGEDQPSELIRIALVRAYFSEELCKRIGAEIRANDGFLRGLLSVMDVILGMPRDQVLAELMISDTVKKWLVDQPYLSYELYDALAAFEQGNWLPLSVQVAQLDLDEAVVSDAYLAAVERSDQIMTAL